MAHARVVGEHLVERRLGLTVRRVLLLNVFLTVAAAALFAFGPARLEQLSAPVELPWPLITLAICACELLAVNLHLRGETHAVSLGDIPIVLGLFFVAPAELVIAVLIGDAIALGVVQRQPAVKLWFNLSRFAVEVSLAAIVFFAIVESQQAVGPLGWFAAAVGLASAAVVGALLVQLAIYLTERSVDLRDLGWTVISALGASLTNVALGVAGVVVVWRDPAAALLLITPAVVMTLAYRAYRRERHSREQSEHLARATHAICEAPDAEHAIAALLDHANEMFGARRAELVLLSHDGATTVLRAKLEPGRRVARPRAIDPSSDAVWNAVAGLRRAVRLPEAASPKVQEGLRAEGIQDAIAAPIVHAGNFKGAVLVADPVDELEGFRSDHVALVELLAAHAGAALEVDRLSESFTELRRLERELRHHALHDSLTGLANRVLFVERLKHALTRRSEAPLAVLFIDLDDFKSVNDTHGHAAGDQVLVRAATRLQRCLRPHDTAARLGGDEFGVLLEDVVDEAEAEHVADRIARALRDEGSNGHSGTRVSVGIAMAKPGVATSEELLRNADLAMYAAKDGGKDRKAMFQPTMYEQAVLRYSLGAELPAAIRNDELDVHYQPILALDGRRIAGHEALVRWRHPKRGELLPTEFLPVAEASGVMSEVFRFTLGRALADCSQLGRLDEGFVCVNVSGSQLEHPHFLTDLQKGLADSGVPADRLILEVVETELMDGLLLATARLEAVRRLGVRVAIDDFGTGHSSLEHLVRLPVDIIKIPRSLTTDTAHNRRVSALLDAVRAMADELDLTVVAEGLEEEDQVRTLTEIGIPYGQGFLLGRPQPFRFATQDALTG
jgi:diguanylate cyclase (GGDEF)-like protein